MISMFQGFQRWRQALFWTAKKIRRQIIRGITRRRSKSNARGACRIIRGNSTSRFYIRLRAMGMIQKQGNWVSYELKPRDGRLKGDFSFANSWFKDNREKVFCIGLWLEMRSGYSTTTPRRKNTTLSPVNRCHRLQHQYHGRTFMIRRSCSISGGTKSCLL